MGGPSGAAAYASSSHAGRSEDKRHRPNASVHSLRKTTQYSPNSNSNSVNEYPAGRADRDSADRYDENEVFLDERYSDDDEEDGDDYNNYDDDQVRAAEHAEMKKHFNFPLQKRRTLKHHLIGAVQKKRRLLMRNENLRFRELYRAPEPIVLAIAVLLVTIVSLILNRSWPFY